MVHASGGCRGNRETLEDMGLAYPEIDAEKRKDLEAARKTLMKE